MPSGLDLHPDADNPNCPDPLALPAKYPADRPHIAAPAVAALCAAIPARHPVRTLPLITR